VKTTKAEVIAELWHRGALTWLLRPHQTPIYNKIRQILASSSTHDNSYVIDCARQFGKSFIMFLIAVETCLRTPKKTVVYVAPLKSQVNEIIDGNTFGVMFKTCPIELVPKHDGSTLVFSNGSRIRLAGTDNRNYLNLRGGAAHLILLDEAGFMSDLEFGVLPTIEPMLKTTGGKVIYASTPPENLDHDYLDIVRDHEEQGLISTFTIEDDTSVTEKELEAIINRCKGRDSTKFKREYLCQRVAESSVQVFPELSVQVCENILIKQEEYEKIINDPLLQYWKKYVVADWGGKDLTAVLFAHYNYRLGKVIIQDHLSLVGQDLSSARIAQGIRDKVNELWCEDSYQRNITYICDNNNILIQSDMINVHKLNFISTTKEKLKSQMVQKVRDWIYDSRIYFAPPAEFAMKSSSAAHWAKGDKDTFAKSKVYGHYDHAASLVYLIRNIDDISDPLPMLLGIDPYTHFINPTLQKLPGVGDTRELVKVFNPRQNLSFRR
jgi:Terminase large subunit, T4likevirus-type, N-terminal